MSKTRRLRTASDVIDALGGNMVVMALIAKANPDERIGSPAISAWRATNRLPSKTYLLFTNELSKLGKRAASRLFSMIGGT